MRKTYTFGIKLFVPVLVVVLILDYIFTGRFDYHIVITAFGVAAFWSSIVMFCADLVKQSRPPKR